MNCTLNYDSEQTEESCRKAEAGRGLGKRRPGQRNIFEESLEMEGTLWGQNN